jgi:DNA-binding GntR family transcriptional regulator
MVQVVAEHQRIVQALEEHDADEALRAVSDHPHTSDSVLAETVPEREAVR